MGKITANDRLIFTLLFSVILHLVVVLGVTFDVSSPLTNQRQMSLDITLVKQQTEETPKEADFLAQVNNDGGGETETKKPEPSPDIPLPPKQAPPASEVIAQKAPITNKSQQQTISIPKKEATTSEQAKKPTPKKAAKENTTISKAIVQKKAERIVQEALKTADKRQQESVEPAKKTPHKLILPNLSEIAVLQNKLDTTAKALSKRPKKRKLSASTKEYAAAAYMRGWEMKVERIGNFNYPQEAKRLGINGSLMLTVDINPDGSVPPDGIVISRSSGHKILDDAAVRIVRLGAPYSAIPDNVLQDSDMLTIIRTWKFETNQGLSTR